MRKLLLLSTVCLPLVASATITVTIKSTTDADKTLGNVTFQNTQHGLLITPNLSGLKPGLHGFHIHQVPSCKNKGHAAEGHLDPENTGKHAGPYATDGHLGDLPVLAVDQDGKANTPILAPRLKEKDLKNHAVIIHTGGDNYSDTPEKLGGGGDRVGCGVIK